MKTTTEDSNGVIFIGAHRICSRWALGMFM